MVVVMGHKFSLFFSGLLGDMRMGGKRPDARNLGGRHSSATLQQKLSRKKSPGQYSVSASQVRLQVAGSGADDPFCNLELTEYRYTPEGGKALLEAKWNQWAVGHQEAPQCQLDQI